MNEMRPAQQASPTARRIRGLLAENGHTQSDLAAVLELSQSAVARRLAGDVAFRDTELRVIATWLDVTAADLLAA